MSRRIDSTRKPRVRIALVIVLGALSPLPAQGQGSASVEPPSAPPAWSFTRGETAIYSIAIGRFKLGGARLSVDDIQTVGDRQVVQATLSVEGGPPFFRIENRLASWIDPRRLRSVRFERRIREGPKRYRDRYILDQETGVFTAERWSDELGSFQPSPVEESGPMPPDAIDELAFLYFVRTLPLEPGDVYTLDRYFKERSNPIRVTILGREEIRVPAGRFHTIVVEPILPELGVFQANKRPRVWITDDDRRIIVKVQTSAPVGAVALNLTDYAEGVDSSGRSSRR